MKLTQFQLSHLITLTVVAALAVNAFLFSWRLFAMLAISLVPAYTINRLLSSKSKRETSYRRGASQTAIIAVLILLLYALSIGPVTKFVFDFKLEDNAKFLQVLEAVYEPLGLLDDGDNLFTPLWRRYRESWYPEIRDEDAQTLPSSYYVR